MTAPLTLLEEVALLAVDLGLGTYELGGTIYLGRLPQGDPDVCMAIAPYPGGDADAGLPWDKPRFQFRCRGKKNDAVQGYRLARTVWVTLHGLGSRSLRGGTWMVQCLGVNNGPALMGYDQNGRDEYAVNMEIEVSTNVRRARAV